MTKTQNLIVSLFVATILLFLLQACGSETEEKKVEFIIDWEPGIDYIGYYVAKEKGFYDSLGVKVTLRHVNGAPLSARLIGSGEELIGTTTADQVVLARTRRDRSGSDQENLQIKAVATIFSRNPVVVASLSDDPITEIEDLVGKRLGVNTASVTYKQYRLLAERRGIADSVREVDIGWGGTTELMQDRIDALLAYSMVRPVSLEHQLEDDSTDHRKVKRLFLSSVKDSGGNALLDIPGQVIAVHGPALDYSDRRELLSKVVKASLKGWQYAKDSPQEALKIFKQRYKDQNMEIARMAIYPTMNLVSDSILTNPISKRTWQNTFRAVDEMEGIGSSRKYTPSQFYEKLDTKK